MSGAALPTVPRASWVAPTRPRIRALRERLAWVYGVPVQPPHRDPLAELVLTVLSQSTNDRNRDVAYLRLVERLPSWELVAAAPVEEIEAAIRPGGISKVKSVRIAAILAAIEQRSAAAARELGLAPPAGASPLDLSWMERAPVAAARDFLCDLPGVGRKTAACVLLFAYDRHDIPVDTHVQRVGTRLGLFRPGAPLDELHDEMLWITPVGAGLEFHVNLLRHGRRTCHARRPACPQCPLRRSCPGRVR
ncbi:endonuclease III domain-containing protein [Patulibacter defluvii]|uniref:endonuclease III domain-containing protein n=1 Tax=Patulibacter defluvii TaxID=3095358 RepID=UPI002A759135|nr:DNA lyase [Patulibacter sp. DM4]